MAVKDPNYNYQEELETKVGKQCATIRHYEEIMKDLHNFTNHEHTADEYKEFVKSKIWFEIMEEEYE